MRVRFFLRTLIYVKHHNCSMKKVKDLHGQLQLTVGSLSDKIGVLLKEKERNFLAAYRNHMWNVQKELQEAKIKVKEAENAVKNNNQVRKLKQERDWFQNEAIRLDNLVKELKEKLKEKHEEIKESIDDRAWIERQLKNAKKQIKILRTELETLRRDRKPQDIKSSKFPSPVSRSPPRSGSKSRVKIRQM